MTQNAGLFGLKYSNRDFSLKSAWGKNQFNSSFPAALCCYLHSKNLAANYLQIKNSQWDIATIDISDVFGIDPFDQDIYFSFESAHTPFQKFIIGSLPRTDLVIQKRHDGQCLAGLEIKLTALPDNTTCNLEDHQYGSEIVVRPDTIVYLACSIAKGLGKRLDSLLSPIDSILDWSEPSQVLGQIDKIIENLRRVAYNLEHSQSPFLIQPVWKTLGKSAVLADYCLDVFAWSNAAFLYFISDLANPNLYANKITRQTRSAIWLFKMLSDIQVTGRFNHLKIVDELSFNTKNDKAFASAGNVTNQYMASLRLSHPVIHKNEIKHIILGDGQELLSPERRFDAILVNSPELFS